MKEAEHVMKQSLALFRECGDQIRVSVNNVSLAIIAMGEARYAEARVLCEEALPAYRKVPIQMEDVPLYLLGAIAVIEGDLGAAKAWYTECLLFDQEIGFYNQLPECLIGFASIASSERHFERAAQLLGAAKPALAARQDLPLETFDQAELERLVLVLREQLGDADFEVFAAKGRSMTPEQMIAFALEKLE